MKNFLKIVLAVIVGFFITSILLFFFMIGILTSLVPSKEVVSIESKSIIKFTFDRPIVERSSGSPFEDIDWLSMSRRNVDGLNEILDNIAKAKEDTNILGIYLELSSIDAGLSTVKEIRQALADFKKSGKFIIAYSDYLTQKGYYLASIADKIYLNPQGSIEWQGLRSEIMFFKGSLEKLGVEPIIIRHGKYKSAVEPFSNDRMSPENRHQLQQLVDVIWQDILNDISLSRNIKKDSLHILADKLIAFDPQSCFNHRMVDSLKYQDEIKAVLCRLTSSREDKLNLIDYRKYVKVPKNYKGKGLAKDKIAIIYAYGDVIMGKGDEGTVSSERISQAISEARKDSSIKAIVLRINSPGGSALASEVIWREIKLTTPVKPVVASLGDVAASGGYYIACASNAIVAQPTTITGSIGVFGILMNAKELLNKKLGITTDVVKTNPYADFPSFSRPMESFEKTRLEMEINRIYKTFIQHVADGRRMTLEQVDALAQGRVWSGYDAFRIQLVDTLGNIDDAIRIAANMAKISEYRIVAMPKLEDPIEKLIKELTESSEAKITNKLSTELPFIRTLISLGKMEKVQARLPFELTLY
ncbi:MAG: signal peptide peptidase SppA [Bacteroidales bacterium]|nr:signal peptide peptidase SppA [Bacteroidales bacterium]